MSKERLEEIKEYFGFWMNNDISREWSLSSETIDNLKYLIEQAKRAQELEKERNEYKNALSHLKFKPTHMTKGQYVARGIKISNKVLRKWNK